MEGIEMCQTCEHPIIVQVPTAKPINRITSQAKLQIERDGKWYDVTEVDTVVVFILQKDTTGTMRRAVWQRENCGELRVIGTNNVPHEVFNAWCMWCVKYQRFVEFGVWLNFTREADLDDPKSEMSLINDWLKR